MLIFKTESPFYKKTGDLFNSFSTTIGPSLVDLNDTKEGLDDTHDDYEETLQTLKMLTDKLKDNTFDDLDIYQSDKDVAKIPPELRGRIIWGGTD